jgi:transcriptional regulator
MYIPKPFGEERIDVLHEAMRRAGLATLVTLAGDGLIASHIPLLLDPEPAPYGTLLGHLARPNPQARGATGDALAIFLGPDAYITPSWYPTKRETGKVVPTWNYVAVHAYGRLDLTDDPAHLRELVGRLTERHEQSRPQPWQTSDAPDDFVASMVRGIIGFRLVITRLEGKWKMSQNRPLADRLGVVDGLTAEGRHDVAALARPPAE